MLARVAARLWALACSTAAASTAAALLSAHPARIIPPPRTPPPSAEAKTIPDLAAPRQCSYGTLTQAGRAVWIDRRDCPTAIWAANGRILPNGLIVLDWIDLTDGRPAVSVYRLEKTGLVGEWGWANEATVDAAGKIRGKKLQASAILFYSTIPPKD